MIRYIKGTYAMSLETGIVVETASGIGFEISIPSGSPIYKYSEGDEVLVYTYMMVKEDDISLYGFHNRENLDLFRLLITVNGVGAKAAMAIMGSMTASELRQAVIFEDVKSISRANGIGKKTAERLILELKDKIGSAGVTVNHQEQAAFGEGGQSMDADARSEAISALAALGYTKAEAFAAVSAVSDEGLECEEYIKRALKNI